MNIDPTGSPTISIVTPSFDQGRFIEETIRSVLSQAGDFFLDYLVIDGASRDNTVDMLRKYDSLLHSGQWPVRCRGIRYRWVSEPDRGQTDAIAKGFALAQGGIFAWLNSDDVYTDGVLDRIARLFRGKSGIDVIYGKGTYVSEDGSPVGSYPTESFDRIRLAVADFICQPSAFFRRSAYERCGGVDVGLRYAMDYDLWIRMAMQGDFLYLPEVLSFYRLHGESKTVAERHALENHRECLSTVVRYFHWAPVNRVVGYAYRAVKHASPPFVSRRPWLVFLGALPMAVYHYFRLNTWIRLADLRLITPRNVRKLLSMERFIQ